MNLTRLNMDMPTNKLLRQALMLICVVVLLFAAGSVLAQSGNQELGETARKAYAESQKTAETTVSAAPSDASLKTLIATVVLLTAVIVLLGLALLNLIATLVNFRPFAKVSSNKWNGYMMIVFMITGVFSLLYIHFTNAKYLLPPSASAHGVQLDSMLQTTVVITGIAFVITQFLLFYFAYRYRGKPGQKAIYYHDNSKLELFWTAIPAVVMAGLVLFGVRSWASIHYVEQKNPLNVELVGKQFVWAMRYGGADNQLGKANYTLVSGTNDLGLDFKDAASHDDIIPSTADGLVLPVNRPIYVHVRAKDVLHGVYMPQFRVQIYAVPGMPTEFKFTPITTTKQMRERLGKPDFNYEMACSQLCGGGHWSMHMNIVVVTEAEYAAWLAKQKPFYTPDTSARVAVAPLVPAVGTKMTTLK